MSTTPAIRQEMQAIVRNSLINEGCFSYAFTRLLVDKIKQLSAEKKIFVQSNRLYDDVAVIVDYISQQLKKQLVVSDDRDVTAVIQFAENFLAIFEN